MKLMEEKSRSVYNTTIVKKKPGPIQLRPWVVHQTRGPDSGLIIMFKVSNGPAC